METKLKELMSLNAEMSAAEIESRFTSIARLLFGYFAIKKGEKIYLFKEIEFYFYNKHHQDIITHPRISDSLCWYVNDFGGIDLNFPSEICKKYETETTGKNAKKYVLDDSSYFGGILIRQLISEDGNEILEGPWACAELFRLHRALEQDYNYSSLVERNNGMVGYICKPRLNLLTGKQTIERKVDYILGEYLSHPEREKLHEEFTTFKDKRYRYLRCDQLLHDSETNEIYLSPWLKDKEEGHPEFYQRLTNLLRDCGMKPIELKCTRDYWARDYMPIQLGENEFLKYQYYPDYLMRSSNPKDAETRTECTNVLRGMGINCRSTKLIIDGGNMVSCGPYIVMTDKVFTENGKEKCDTVFKAELESELGHPVIIIPWTMHDDFNARDTDKYGHSDGFVKWCGGNRILMGNHGDQYPEEAAAIRRILEEYGFEVAEMRFADKVTPLHKNLNWAYINFLQVGNKIIMPVFNIKEDAIAWQYIHEAFPDCEIHQIEMSEIAEEGGALHCISWNIRR